MRRLSAMTYLLLGVALLTTGCRKLDFFKRSASPVALVKGPRIGTPAPDIEGEDFNGQRFKLSDYRGNVVVVTFWASWCRPCCDLIPHERAIAERYQKKKFVLLGANIDTNPDAARRVMAARGVTWRNWQAGGDANPIQARWPVELLPTIYVIDARGIIRYTRVSGADLENAIDTLLAEADASR